MNCVFDSISYRLQSAALFALLRRDERDKRFIYSLRRHQFDCQLHNACARTIQVAWRRYHAVEPGASPYRKGKSESVVFEAAYGCLTLHYYPVTPVCDSLYLCTSIQRELRKKSIGDYVSPEIGMLQCRDIWLSSLRQEQKSTLDRLRNVERRLDSLVAAATAAVNKPQ